MKLIPGLIIAPIAGVTIAILLVINYINPPESPRPADYDPARIATLISEGEAEEAARNNVDESYQRSGYEEGEVRGGKLRVIILIYVSKDGANFAVDKHDGTLIDEMPHPLPIDSAQPDHYYWKVHLNYGNSTNPEYDFTVDAHSGEVLQMGINN